MGVAVSNWKLASAVSREGQLGVVSGTEIAQIFISRLTDGDLGGHLRRALNKFPLQNPVSRILREYFDPAPRPTLKPYKRPPMWTLKPSRYLTELTVIANFVEVFLAKEGHGNPVGLNLLEKVQLPTLASLYGAMLAGVDYVIMGAGIPLQIPAVLDGLSRHEAVDYAIQVQGSTPDDDFRLHFDPQSLFPELKEKLGNLLRPYFLPIISSVGLAKILLKRVKGRIDGFIIEGPTAGGHNAPPRGELQLDALGEPVYGDRDRVDLKKIQALGLPFWLAGGYDTPEKLREALAAGAAGIQVGTAFSYCRESAMAEELKQQVMQQVLDRDIRVRTDLLASPTSFPFKVVQLPGTLSDPEIYRARPRICDLGMLRYPYRKKDGTVGYRCPAEPVESFLAKGGQLRETVGRQCLCNNLAATAGYPQRRNGGYVEPPIVTAGDGLSRLAPFLHRHGTHYSAREVLNYLLGKEPPTPVETYVRNEENNTPATS